MKGPLSMRADVGYAPGGRRFFEPLGRVEDPSGEGIEILTDFVFVVLGGMPRIAFDEYNC